MVIVIMLLSKLLPEPAFAVWMKVRPAPLQLSLLPLAQPLSAW
jgi:hypothetical protein